ncbi:MAG TPA: hypothetical protein VI142_08210 [Gaiellaceae bacterium]
MTPSAHASADRRTPSGDPARAESRTPSSNIELEGSPSMGLPYRARVDERYFLNLPGFHDGEYVFAYVENTTDRGLETGIDCDDDCEHCPYNFEPKMTLEISDGGYRPVALEFDVDSERGRANTLHKLDTLIAALRVFRRGIVAEIGEYQRREQELEQYRS